MCPFHTHKPTSDIQNSSVHTDKCKHLVLNRERETNEFWVQQA